MALFDGARAQYGSSRAIITAVPYLQINPDARSAALGSLGVASAPDVFSLHWNPAKYSFAEQKFGIAASYSDYLWMKTMWNFGNDISLKTGFNTLHAYYKIKERSAAAFSFKYFGLGEVTFTDEYGNEIGVYEPFDISFDVAYSYRLSPVFSAALAARYIYSDLTQGQYIQGAQTSAGQSVAFDLAVYCQKSLELGSKDGEVRWGADISNIGTKLSYSETANQKEFLPTNLRLGSGFTFRFDENNSLSFQFDANKLLVPTPPVYLIDSNGYPVYDDAGNPVIADGMDPNVSVCKGMIQSWYDAPGGFREEMQEWSVASGFEYRYKTYFSLRTGMYYQHESKVNWRFITAGAGFKVGIFGMDFGLRIPLEYKMKDAYNSFYYLRTSIVFSSLK
jgi:hypothetical protein